MLERAQRYAAKIFAITYLLSLAVLMVVFPRFYAPYLVWENGEETARRFIGHEQAIRIYLAGGFVHGVGMIVSSMDSEGFVSGDCLPSLAEETPSYTDVDCELTGVSRRPL